jgi:hypothetical protein
VYFENTWDEVLQVGFLYSVFPYLRRKYTRWEFLYSVLPYHWEEVLQTVIPVQCTMYFLNPYPWEEVLHVGIIAQCTSKTLGKKSSKW